MLMLTGHMTFSQSCVQRNQSGDCIQMPLRNFIRIFFVVVVFIGNLVVNLLVRPSAGSLLTCCSVSSWRCCSQCRLVGVCLCSGKLHQKHVLSSQAMLVGLIPGIGAILSLFHLAVLYALYSFEYKWIYQGKQACLKHKHHTVNTHFHLVLRVWLHMPDFF